MSLPVEFRRSAEREIREARTWYRQADPGLEKKFGSRVIEAVTLFQTHPLGYREVLPGARRIVLKQFPYSLFYVVEATRLVLIGCRHHAKNPSNWPEP